MIDKQKTEYLREKLQQIKENTSIPTSEEKPQTTESATYYLILFALRYFAFFGSQYYILERTAYKPFGLWESLVIYTSLQTFISIIKKS
jgi:hypothetical protein